MVEIIEVLNEVFETVTNFNFVLKKVNISDRIVDLTSGKVDLESIVVIVINQNYRKIDPIIREINSFIEVLISTAWVVILDLIYVI